MKCCCPDNYIWNGQQCIACTGGRIYQNGRCVCPPGYYWKDDKCFKPGDEKCYNIDNAKWNGTHCVCLPGFSVIGYQCVCKGLDLGDSCDRCFHKPHSYYYYGMCRCKDGYYEINGQCHERDPNPPTPPVTPNCSLATFFDNQEKKCLPCPQGCLQCKTCYSCEMCQPGFTLDVNTNLCDEECGDGKRFVVECDDGNNINNDGCAADCTLEQGYTCYGGSPTEPDVCTSAVPADIIIKATGQTHVYGQIIINVQLNYLPTTLLKSTLCSKKNYCNKILKVDIIDGFDHYKSIVAKYIPTTSYSFSIVIDFGIEPIGKFNAKIKVDPALASYFGGINIGQYLVVEVNPALLSVYMGGKNEEENILV